MPSDFPFCRSPLPYFPLPTARPRSLSPLLCLGKKFTEWPNFVSVFPIVSPSPTPPSLQFQDKPYHVPSRSEFQVLIWVWELELRSHLNFFPDCWLCFETTVTTSVLLVFLLLCCWLSSFLSLDPLHLRITRSSVCWELVPQGSRGVSRGQSMAAGKYDWYSEQNVPHTEEANRCF